MRARKTETPSWVDRLLNFREEITEDEYAEYWKRLNRVRKDRAAWEEEGRRIINELEREERAIFRAADYASLDNARRAAEIHQSDMGGRIVRRDSSGRFSKRGRIFQVIGSRERNGEEV